jgi:hypothetical protein
MNCPIIDKACMAENCMWWDSEDDCCAVQSINIELNTLNTLLRRRVTEKGKEEY